MHRSLPMVLVGLLLGITFSFPAAAQQEKVSSLEAAKRISQATGRPIFAVAGRGT